MLHDIQQYQLKNIKQFYFTIMTESQYSLSPMKQTTNQQSIGILRKMFNFNPQVLDNSLSLNQRKKSQIKHKLSLKNQIVKIPLQLTARFISNQCDSPQYPFIRQQKIVLATKNNNKKRQISDLILQAGKCIRKSRYKEAPQSQKTQSSDTKFDKYEQLMKKFQKMNKDAKVKERQRLNLPMISQIIVSQQCQKARYSVDSALYQNRKRSIIESIQNQGTGDSKLKMYQSKKSLFQMSPKKIYQKGYMYYDTNGLAFWNAYKQNVNELYKFKSLNMIGVTAEHYLIVNTHNLNKIYGKKQDQYIQIASLTKIMTCYLTILICKKYQIDMEKHTLRVSDKASSIPGTSAQLETGDVLTIKQLLFGLMLPSGNDASVALAQGLGKIIQKNKKKPTQKSYYETFISHMNLLARQLQLEQQYQNSSGLAHNPNFSTPISITILTAIAIRNSTFQQIINCKQYSINIKNQRYGLTRKMVWKNTNKLLWKDWNGVKTGTTETAGHCLMSWKDNLLIAVFSSETLSKRFSDCSKIYEIITKSIQNEIIKRNQ